MAVSYTYLGGGSLPGIPARDLSEADVAALDEAQRADVAANAAMEHGAVFAAVEGAQAPPAAAEEENQS